MNCMFKIFKLNLIIFHSGKEVVITISALDIICSPDDVLSIIQKLD